MYKKLILTCLLVLLTGMLFAQDFPQKPGTLVTDYTNTLALQDKDALEHKLVAFNDSTSTQIAVVIIKSVGAYDIAQYGAGLGRAWGIGSKGKNNGILVLVAMDDHKMTIQTGYGAEGAVPDAITSQIIQQDMRPNFKQNNYYAGLDAATTSLMKYMKGEYKADNNGGGAANGADKDQGNGSSIGILIFIVIMILIAIFRRRGGGGGQIIGGRGGASPFWWFLAGSALGGSFNNNDNGGGFGGGGSDSGGGSFGGFGGGDFGGGGSSGNW
jgi:uncharacterized protein